MFAGFNDLDVAPLSFVNDVSLRRHGNPEKLMLVTPAIKIAIFDFENIRDHCLVIRIQPVAEQLIQNQLFD